MLKGLKGNIFPVGLQGILHIIAVTSVFNSGINFTYMSRMSNILCNKITI